MYEEKMFMMVKELCKVCGMSIDRIAKECDINQDLVAKMFIETMQTILDKMEKR